MQLACCTTKTTERRLLIAHTPHKLARSLIHHVQRQRTREYSAKMQQVTNGALIDRAADAKICFLMTRKLNGLTAYLLHSMHQVSNVRHARSHCVLSCAVADNRTCCSAAGQTCRSRIRIVVCFERWMQMRVTKRQARRSVRTAVKTARRHQPSENTRQRTVCFSSLT